MIAVVLGEPCWQVLFRHEHAAWVDVAHVEYDQIATVIILGNAMGRGGAAEPVHRKKANGILIEQRGEHAPHSALFAPHLYSMWLLVPEVAAIGSCHTAGVFGGIIPG